LPTAARPGNERRQSRRKPRHRNSRLHHLRRFYYDTAASTNPVNMQALKMLVGRIADRVRHRRAVRPAPPQVAGLKSIGFNATSSPEGARNALALLPRFA